MGLVARKPVFGVSDQVSNQSTQLQRVARIFFHFTCSKRGDYIKQKTKGAEKTARERRLVCVLVDSIQQFLNLKRFQIFLPLQISC